MDYCFRLCYVKVLGSLQDKNEKSKQQKNPVSISFQFICPRRCIYRFLFLLKNATSKFQIIRQSILTQLRPQLLTPTMQRNTKISLWQHSDRQGGGGGLTPNAPDATHTPRHARATPEPPQVPYQTP